MPLVPMADGMANAATAWPIWLTLNTELGMVATHLAAGRPALALRMIAKLEKPAAVPEEAWNALRAFTAWRAGEGETPPRDMLPRVALHFRSLRRAGLLEVEIQN